MPKIGRVLQYQSAQGGPCAGRKLQRTWSEVPTDVFLVSNVGLVGARMAATAQSVNATTAWAQFLSDAVVPGGITAEKFTESVSEVEAATLLQPFLDALAG